MHLLLVSARVVSELLVAFATSIRLHDFNHNMYTLITLINLFCLVMVKHVDLENQVHFSPDSVFDNICILVFVVFHFLVFTFLMDSGAVRLLSSFCCLVLQKCHILSCE